MSWIRAGSSSTSGVVGIPVAENWTGVVNSTTGNVEQAIRRGFDMDHSNFTLALGRSVSDNSLTCRSLPARLPPAWLPPREGHFHADDALPPDGGPARRRDVRLCPPARCSGRAAAETRRRE